MKKVLFALSALVVVATACKKDNDEPESVTPTQQNLIGSYKVTKIMLTSSGQTSDVTNQYQQMLEPCEKDDLHKLSANNVYEYVDAGTKCTDDGSYTDTWSLTNSTTLVFDGDTYTIKSYNGKTLELTGDMGMGIIQTTTFTKQ